MLITTIYKTPDNPEGLMEESLYIKKEGIVDNENEHTTWVEYWNGNVLVHRSAHVTLKPLKTKPELGKIN